MDASVLNRKFVMKGRGHFSSYLGFRRRRIEIHRGGKTTIALEWDADRVEVVIQPRPSRRGGPFGESERLDVLSFLARVLDPVPEPRQQQVRYWGWYSNAARGQRRKAELGAEGRQDAAASADSDRPLRPRRNLSWARLIKRVYVRR